MDTKSIKNIFTADKERFIREWSELLRFKSISTDPAFNDDCQKCAQWLVQHLKGIGCEARLLETSSKPVVFAEYKGRPGKPTVVFYGHYDVQPPDPLEAWLTPPFEPMLRDNRLYARGAEDNKGQLFYVIKALESLIKHQALDCSVKLFLEGEEESGSQGIAGALDGWKDLVRGDVLMVCDTGTVPSGAPTITMGLRGIAHCSIELHGPRYDLHSGVHGGAVKNPATEMAHLIASLHNADGGVAVKDFYAGVQTPNPRDRELAMAGTPTVEQYVGLTGVSPNGGEKQYSLAERVGFRPTIEVNGITAGYGGAGAKTIIPATAKAKLSLRLVSGQDIAETMERVIAHLKERVPHGMQFIVNERDDVGPAFQVSSESSVVKTAARVLSTLSDLPVVYRWEGASIPIISRFASVSGGAPILVGFGAEEDKIHAPNESFSLEQFERGFLYACGFLAAVGS